MALYIQIYKKALKTQGKLYRQFILRYLQIYFNGCNELPKTVTHFKSY